MSRWRCRSAQTAALVAALVLTWQGAPAWSDDDVPVVVAIDPAAFAGHATSPGPAPLVSSDDLLSDALARAGADWFAGIYEDHGATVVLTTQPGLTRNELTPAVGALLEVGILSDRDPLSSVEILPAQYAFGALNAWKRSLEDDFFALDGAVLTDLDERADRIVLGFDATRLPRTAVQAMVEQSGVVPDAVEIRAVPPVAAESMQDHYMYALGGLQIQNRQTGFLCTLGFSAVWRETYGFVTNDHCTASSGVADGDYFYQPTSANRAWLIGVETVDPPLFTGGACPRDLRCRYSDAAFVVIPPAVPNTLGLVASMTQLNRPDAWDGSLSSIAAAGTPVSGRAVYKIGRTTGKTEGVITSTCLSVLMTDSDIVRLCQDRASYDSAPGDSGSPVLGAVDGQDGRVDLYGIHWGGGGVYSRIAYVSSELGGLDYVEGTPPALMMPGSVGHLPWHGRAGAGGG